MLTQQLLAQLQFLNSLETQVFTKIINYAVNFLLNQENQMKINQFIEIEENEGDRITAIVLRMIEALAQYRTNVNELAAAIKLLKLDKQKHEFLHEKISSNLQELRKVIFREELNDLTQLQGLQWRFEVQLASKNYKQDYKPNIMLNFRVNQGTRIMNNFVNSDFANIKNLQSCLNEAMKQHQSSRYKTARNSAI